MKSLIGISLVIVLAIAGSASAAFFGEDFESFLGQYGAGPHAASGGGDFTFATTSGNTYFSIADPTGAGHGNVLRFLDGGSPFNKFANMGINMSASTTAAITFNYDIYFPAADIIDGNTFLTTASRDTTNAINMNASWRATGGAQEYRNNIDNSLVSSWAADTWYNVELAFSSIASGRSTYDIKITRESDSVVMAYQTQNYNIQPTNYNFMEFTGGLSAGNENVKAYLDNLNVGLTPPPPSPAEFYETFNNMALGALTSSTPTTNGGSWTVNNMTGGSSAQIISDPTGAGAGNVLHLVDGSATGFAEVIAAMDPGDQTTGEIHLGYNIYFPSSGLNANTGLVAAMRGTGWKVLTQWDGSGTPRYFSKGASPTGTIFEFEADTWYRVNWLLRDVSESQFQVLIYRLEDGLFMKAMELGYFGGLPSSWSQFELVGGGLASNTVDVYIDDIRMMPEPTTAMIMLVGLATLMRRRGGTVR